MDAGAVAFFCFPKNRRADALLHSLFSGIGGPPRTVPADAHEGAAAIHHAGCCRQHQVRLQEQMLPVALGLCVAGRGGLCSWVSEPAI
jgi:hypothetical protein